MTPVYTKSLDGSHLVQIGWASVDATGTMFVNLSALPVNGQLIIGKEQSK